MHAEGARNLVFGVDEEGDAAAALRNGFDCRNGVDGSFRKQQSASSKARKMAHSCMCSYLILNLGKTTGTLHDIGPPRHTASTPRTNQLFLSILPIFLFRTAINTRRHAHAFIVSPVSLLQNVDSCTPTCSGGGGGSCSNVLVVEEEPHVSAAAAGRGGGGGGGDGGGGSDGVLAFVGTIDSLTPTAATTPANAAYVSVREGQEMDKPTAGLLVRALHGWSGLLGRAGRQSEGRGREMRRVGVVVDWVDKRGRIICALARGVVHSHNVLHRGAGVMIRNDEVRADRVGA